MDVVERLDVDELRSVVVAFRDVLVAHRQVINQLNVYPVPDGDTGTNMSLTLDAVVAEVQSVQDPDDLAALCAAISHGSLMGARGNSGVILSQLLRGASEVIAASGRLDADTWARALRAASDGAYRAVMRPVEGTILTVAREVADAAEEAAGAGLDVVEVLERCRTAGSDSLARTPELLAALAEAGVVDAGGAGFVLLLDAALHVLDGRPLPAPPEVDPGIGIGRAATAASLGHAAPDDQRYEVMFLLEAPDEAIPAFTERWGELGDSIVVVGGDGLWNCHVHCGDIGAAIEAALDHGRPRQIRVTDLAEQVEHLETGFAAGAGADVVSLVDPSPVTTAVVAVGVGDGVRRIFESLGVKAVVMGGQTMNPSTAQLLEAVERVPADAVVVLPNNKNIIPVAEQVDSQTAKVVRVVPSRSVAEGFAALLAYDPGSGPDDNVAAMADAADAVVAGEVTRAVRPSTWADGPIAEGDWIGLARDGIRAVGSSLVDASCALLDQLVTDDHELVTVIVGTDAGPDAVDAVVEWLAEHRPDVEVEVHRGGQPLYPFFFGVE